MAQTKQQQIASMVDKEQSKFDKRIKELTLRLEQEAIKNAPIDGTDKDVMMLVEQVRACVTNLGLNEQKLIDFLAKEFVGVTARIVYRVPRTSKIKIPKFGK